MNRASVGIAIFMVVVASMGIGKIFNRHSITFLSRMACVPIKCCALPSVTERTSHVGAQFVAPFIRKLPSKGILGTPVVPFSSFCLGVYLLKLNMRNKVSLLLRGYWGT